MADGPIGPVAMETPASLAAIAGAATHHPATSDYWPEFAVIAGFVVGLRPA